MRVKFQWRKEAIDPRHAFSRGAFLVAASLALPVETEIVIEPAPAR